MNRCRYGAKGTGSAGARDEIAARLQALWAVIATSAAVDAEEGVDRDSRLLDRIATLGTRAGTCRRHRLR